MANKSNHSAGNILLKILIALLLVAGLVAASFLLGQKQIFKNRAAEETAKLLVVPQTVNLPGSVKILLTPPTGQKPVFIKLVTRFNQNQVQLTSDPKPGKNYDTIISLTTVSEANTSGTIIAILGLDPEKSGQASLSPEVLRLNFDIQPNVFLPQNGSAVLVGTEDSHVVIPPQTKQNLTVAQTRLLSDKTITQESADLGLKLKVSQDPNGKKYISALWNSISDQNFESFVIAVRDASTQNLVTGSRDADLKDTTIDLTNLPTLSSGSYYVNLRAKYTQKTVIQFPKKYFTVQSSGNIITN